MNVNAGNGNINTQKYANKCLKMLRKGIVCLLCVGMLFDSTVIDAFGAEPAAAISRESDGYDSWVTGVAGTADGGDAPVFRAARAAHSHVMAAGGSSITFAADAIAGESPLSGNIYLAGDRTLSSHLPVDGTANLCLNGHVLSGSVQNGMVRVESGDSLNVCDCSSAGTGKILCSGINNPILVEGGGSLRLYGGTVEAEQRTAIPVGTSGGSSSQKTVLEVNGGKVQGGTNGILINNGYSNVTLHISGGVVTAANYAINAGNGTVTVSGGTVKTTGAGNYGFEIKNNNVSLHVSGGEISGTKNAVYHNGSALVLSGAPVLTSGSGCADILLASGRVITLGGALTGGPYVIDTAVKPSAGSPVVITSGWDSAMSGKNPADYFVSLDSNYSVMQQGTELVLAVKGAHSHDVSTTCGGSAKTFQKLSAIGGTLTAGSYYLDSDQRASGVVNITGEVNLCLNGHDIDMASYYFEISTGGSLNLCDCSGNVRYGSWSGSSYAISANAPEGSDRLTGGVIKSSYRTVYTDGGSFFMYGGNIAGGQSNGVNGMVQIDSGNFSMYGGAICGNRGKHCVFIGSATSAADSAHFTMEGGRISHNKASENWGGGVYIFYGGVFRMDDGEISGNEAVKGGAGVHIDTVQSGRQTGSVVLAGGTITGNRLTGSSNNFGGGVYFYTGSLTLEDSGVSLVISNNMGKAGSSVSNLAMSVNTTVLKIDRTFRQGDSVGITAFGDSSGNAGDRNFTNGYSAKNNTDPDSWFIPDMEGYIVKRTADSAEARIEKYEHVHQFTYKAQGAALKGVCDKESCSTSPTTVTAAMEAPGALTYDGSAKAVKVSSDRDWPAQNQLKVTYLREGESAEKTAAPVDAGSYTAYLRCTKSSEAAQLKFTVLPKDIASAEVELGEALTYTGNSQTQSIASVTLDGRAVTYTVSGNTGVNAGSYTLTVTGTGNYTGTARKEYTVSPKPVSLNWSKSSLVYTGEEQSVTAQVASDCIADGDLVQVTSYKGNQAVDPGNYSAEALSLSNDNYTLEGGSHVRQAWSISMSTVPEGIRAILDGPEGEDGWYAGEVSVCAPEGYEIMPADGDGQWADSFTVSEEGTQEVSYRLKDTNGGITEPMQIEVKIDLSSPEGEIRIKENAFRSCMKFISFGLFFKNTIEVIITGTDALSGVARIEYQSVEKESDYAQDGVWTLLADSDRGSFSVPANSKSIVYARITDRAGHFTIVNSQGIVVYTDAEQSTSEISFTRNSGNDVEAYAITNGNTLKEISVTDGSGAVSVLKSDLDYAVEYRDAGRQCTVVLKASWLEKLTAGAYALKLAYNPLGMEYVENPVDGVDQNDAPKTTDIVLTVIKAARTVSVTEDITKVYDGAAVSRPEYEPNITAVTEYRARSAADSAYSRTAPYRAGDYTVRVTIPADEIYQETSAERAFSITKRPLVITAKNQTIRQGEELLADAYVITGGSLAAQDVLIQAVLAANGQEIVPGEFRIRNVAGEDVTDCYAITPRNGKLTVVPQGADIRPGVLDEPLTQEKVDAAFGRTGTESNAVLRRDEEGNTVIVLQRDVELKTGIEAGTDITIDLAGHDVTAPEGSPAVEAAADSISIVIRDSASGGHLIGGNGRDAETNNAAGGDGTAAIVVRNRDNVSVIIESGATVTGGDGGDGRGSGKGGRGGSGVRIEGGSGDSFVVDGTAKGGKGGDGGIPGKAPGGQEAAGGSGKGGDGGTGASLSDDTQTEGNGTAAGGDGGNSLGGTEPGQGGRGLVGGHAQEGQSGITDENGESGSSLVTKLENRSQTSAEADMKAAVDACVKKQDIQGGNKVEIRLILEDIAKPTRAEKKKAGEILRSIPAQKLGGYIDISLIKTVTSSAGTADRQQITNTDSMIAVTIAIPAALKDGSDHQIIRLHADGTGTLTAQALSTVVKDGELHFETDRFSTYVIAYTPAKKGNGNPANKDSDDDENISHDDGKRGAAGASDVAKGQRDNEPRTGDSSLPFATLGMIAGLTWLTELFCDKKRRLFGMTERQKNRIVSFLIEKARNKSLMTRYAALAVIFLILVFYYSIGKIVDVEGQETLLV